jgi:uncharacterized RDD family membrane protein YckC
MRTQDELAGLWIRFFAAIVDALILMIPCYVANRVIPLGGGIILVFLYGPIFESSRAQATIGKYFFGIQVTDEGGQRISLRSALVRYFVKVFSSVFLFLGHFLALLTDRKQALHDLLARTVVVYGQEQNASLIDDWVDNFKEGIHANSESPRSTDVFHKLEKLNELRQKGILTDEEFQEQKKRILGQK